jgi:hypothetical protein
MKDYLTQNKNLIEEVSSTVHPLKISEKQVGASDKMCFIPSGNFQSQSKGLVYAGLKMHFCEGLTKQNIEEFYIALTNISLIHEKHPEISHQLPLFYGLLADSNNKPQAIITQDFSKGGKYLVEEHIEFPHANVPDGLVDLFTPSSDDMSQLERALFYVNGKRKIGDLDHLFPKEKYEQEWDKLKNKVQSSNPIINFTKVPLEELFTNENERRYANLVLKACEDGPKEHIDLIHVDKSYKINLSTQINKILQELVNNFYLKTWRDEKHPCKDKVFALS